ncbi:MAG: hypothetical protein UY33_C0031G0017 [Candidatus Amesbacteria bacterium GW2011_GWA1_48_9]|uniref:Transposase IS200-like domain-containing protein n=1 Tax=Candidatus Amesbacteria bacterium GW2011_GWA1_48_9 TaxID=1618355 RepID=A0A0G1UZA1_9BACT|nr:MAG: hypothetical protein UY33_C0031G0017 [Candidatus Amesbacteria bacterium GW2011_GWA1_48_9]
MTSGRIYHIYNRGVDGRVTFSEAGDYDKFLDILRGYLGEFKIEEGGKYKSERPYLSRHRQKMNLFGQVKLVGYCLMPNHYHLILQPEGEETIAKLMRRAGTTYTMYFNKKYKRIGTLWETGYRCEEVWGDERILHLTRWVHLNPAPREVRRFGLVETVTGFRPEEFMYSSYQYYLTPDKTEGWVHPEVGLALFASWNDRRWANYQKFVEDRGLRSEVVLGRMAIDAGREK